LVDVPLPTEPAGLLALLVELFAPLAALPVVVGCSFEPVILAPGARFLTTFALVSQHCVWLFSVPLMPAPGLCACAAKAVSNVAAVTAATVEYFIDIRGRNAPRIFGVKGFGQNPDLGTYGPADRKASAFWPDGLTQDRT